MRRRAGAGALALLAAAALGPSCASTHGRAKVVPFPDTAAAATRPTGLINSYEKALNAVLWVMEGTLSFPPLYGSLHLYAEKDDLQAALIAKGYDAGYALQIVNTLDGIGTPSGILANEASLTRQHWPIRIVFLAHEMTHVAEYTLAGGRRAFSDQWLREGLAEWVSWSVMDALRFGSLAARRRNAAEGVRAANHRHQLPSVEELLAVRSWSVLSARQRSNAMYDEAFLAAELLVARHGLPKVLDYFRLTARSADASANFHAAFGEELPEFQSEFHTELAQLLK